MSGNIPYATPYPWDNNSDIEKSQKVAKKLINQPFVGSGFASLRDDSRQMSDLAKTYLTNLLQDHGVGMNNNNKKNPLVRNVDELYGLGGSGLEHRKALQAGIPDEEVLKLARDGKISLFFSLLSIIETSDHPVSTKTLLKTCCLAVKPGDLPGSIDAKEMVLAALHFLSARFQVSSEEHIPSLPLIRPIHFTGDLEKRNYEIAGKWKLAEIQDKVLRLEQIFISSPDRWKWLRREAFCPRLSQKDETSFFQKGVIPPSASAKKPKGESTRKRKAAASPTPSTAPSHGPNSPVAEAADVAEATGAAGALGTPGQDTNDAKKTPLVEEKLDKEESVEKKPVEEKPDKEETVEKKQVEDEIVVQEAIVEATIVEDEGLPETEAEAVAEQ